MIQLHLDMSVDPRKEQEMLSYFTTVFRPAAMKFPGYVDVRLLKLRAALAGTAPPGLSYRFAITYQSEELRQKWIASAAHQRVWPLVERTMTTQRDYPVVLYDEV